MNKNNNKTSKSMSNGITLIALVITIIILLILAGISIAALTGDNGLINRAAGAKDATEIAQEKEILQQASVAAMGKSITGDVEKTYLDAELDKNPGSNKYRSNSTSDGIEVTFTGSKRSYLVDTDGNVTKITVMPTVADAPQTAVTENTKYVDPNGDTAVIPEGFKVINGEDQPEIDDGLIVKDGANNEWVWIPVPDASVMYDEISETALCGSTGVTTTKKSKSGIISEQSRTTPGTTSSPYYREPDLVIGSGTKYDYSNYSTAGFSSLADMAQSLVDDYEDMIASVEKNKGFYVGRYELSGSVSSPTERGDKIPLTNQNWYDLYKACKGFTIEGVVESRMIWGCQWDVVCNYIAEDSTYSITDSSTWGNYNNTEVKSSDGNTTIKSSGTSTRLNTGVTTFTMAKNIYDIAGNCWEWTQEAYNTDFRADRGRRLQWWRLVYSSFSPRLQRSH